MNKIKKDGKGIRVIFKRFFRLSLLFPVCLCVLCVVCVFVCCLCVVCALCVRVVCSCPSKPFSTSVCQKVAQAFKFVVSARDGIGEAVVADGCTADRQEV